ncbi:MAG: HEAT repeat domain-containing protein, partial [Sandaracinaceae bacterium]|nr:HEAT repeat domain-containing protein [Sandaracinaceae bacterium]
MTLDPASALRSEDAEERRLAIASLASSNSAERSALLIRGLGDTEWRVRKEATEVAVGVAVEWGLVPALVDALAQGENVGLRNAALEVLEHLGPRAAPALLDALPRVAETARKFIVAALGFAGGAGAEELARLTDDPDPNTAQAALEALARAGGPWALKVLRAHLAAGDPVQRLAAVEGLERLEEQVPLSEIEPLLSDRLVRRRAMKLLAWSDEPGAVSALFAALDEPSGHASVEAGLALGQILSRGGPAAREAIAAAPGLSERARTVLRDLASSPGRVSQAAATLRLCARDPAVLPATAQLLSEDRLTPSGLDALRSWGAGAIGPLLASSADLGPRARAAALELAADLGRLAPLDADTRNSLHASLRAALRSDDEAPAAAAAAAMIHFGV